MVVDILGKPNTKFTDCVGILHTNFVGERYNYTCHINRNFMYGARIPYMIKIIFALLFL